MSAGKVVGVETLTNSVGEPLVQVRGRDDAGDAGVERELEDDAPDRRRRRLHRVHQPRRRAVQQDAEQEEREVDDVEVEAFSGSAACAK